MLALFSASTPKLPPTVAKLSRRDAVASTKIMLVAIRPLAATDVPAAASPAASSVASGSAAAASAAAPSSATGSATTTSPLRVASIEAVAEAVNDASPSASRVKVKPSAETFERTSLRENTPPAATALPEVDTSADMDTSAVMPDSSVADTVRPPPTTKVACAADSRRFLPSTKARVSERTRLLAKIMAAPTDMPVPDSPTTTSEELETWASTAIASSASTLRSPATVASEPRMKARVNKGNSVVPISVPSTLLMPAAAMLPMSQPTALKAKEAPAAAPELL